MTAGTQVFSMELTEDIINKIKTSGVSIQRQGNGTTYDFEIRYVTVSSTGSGIGAIEVDRVIVDNGAIYNLSGQRIGADYKGIVIKNGKKYFNK